MATSDNGNGATGAQTGTVSNTVLRWSDTVSAAVEAWLNTTGGTTPSLNVVTANVVIIKGRDGNKSTFETPGAVDGIASYLAHLRIANDSRLTGDNSKVFSSAKWCLGKGAAKDGKYSCPESIFAGIKGDKGNTVTAVMDAAPLTLDAALTFLTDYRAKQISDAADNTARLSILTSWRDAAKAEVTALESQITAVQDAITEAELDAEAERRAAADMAELKRQAREKIIAERKAAERKAAPSTAKPA